MLQQFYQYREKRKILKKIEDRRKQIFTILIDLDHNNLNNNLIQNSYEKELQNLNKLYHQIQN